MTNYAHGHDAEKVAADYLQRQGYKIVALNWRHKRAEIDIIARKVRRFKRHGPVVFFEVKYRRNGIQGTGLDYVTPQKIRQMRFAAELWMQLTKYSGPCLLGAIEVTGASYEVTACLTDIS